MHFVFILVVLRSVLGAASVSFLPGPGYKRPMLGMSRRVIPMNGGDGGKEERELKMPVTLSLKHQFTKL